LRSINENTIKDYADKLRNTEESLEDFKEERNALIEEKR